MTKHHKQTDPAADGKPAAESGAPAQPPPAPATETPAAGAPRETAAPTLDQQLAEALKAALDWRDKCLRTAADFDNYRKRVQRDLQDTRLREKSGSVQAFLTVLDHFQMAREHFASNPDLKTMQQGLDMIQAEFRNALSALGVETVNAAGAAFDPKLHEAVSQEFSDTVPAGAVVRQWKAGYKLGETLLRPASVVVSGGPNPDAAAQEEG